MFRKKRIKYNGKKAEGNERLEVGDSIQLYLSEETINNFQEIKEIKHTKQTFSVLYEDGNILICNKPLGLLVHPNKSKDTNTLIDEILSYLVRKGEYNPNTAKGFTPAICNRLDRNTGGIVIVGKTLGALQAINQMIKESKIKKYYLTIVKGNIKSKGILKGYHKKNNATNEVEIIDKYEKGSKYVETHYIPIKNNLKFSLIEVEIITGRSHQIRAHLSKINHPIIGDNKYGDIKMNLYFRNKYNLKYQFLHAYKIKFEDSIEPLKYLKGYSFKAELPQIYKDICNDEGLSIKQDNF